MRRWVPFWAAATLVLLAVVALLSLIVFTPRGQLYALRWNTMTEEDWRLCRRAYAVARAEIGPFALFDPCMGAITSETSYGRITLYSYSTQLRGLRIVRQPFRVVLWGDNVSVSWNGQ